MTFFVVVHIQDEDFTIYIKEFHRFCFAFSRSCPFCKESLVKSCITWQRVCSLAQQCFNIPGRLVPLAKALLVCPSTWPPLGAQDPARAGCCESGSQRGRWAGDGLGSVGNQSQPAGIWSPVAPLLSEGPERCLWMLLATIIRVRVDTGAEGVSSS